MIKWIKGLFKKEEKHMFMEQEWMSLEQIQEKYNLVYHGETIEDDMEYLREESDIKLNSLIEKHGTESMAMDVYLVIQRHGMLEKNSRGTFTEKMLYC